MRRLHLEIPVLLGAVALFATMLFSHLSYPLLWQDEGETAMYATRVVETGVPTVHGARNVVYEFGTNLAQGVKERFDVYIGTTWGHFYFAVPGVLWAAGVDDVYAKTWRLRLPFALAGAIGVALLGLAVTPALRGGTGWFLALYFALCAASVSLLLHLREVRYYALFVLIASAIWTLHLRRTVFGRTGPLSYAVWMTLLLFLLFNVFYSAWFAVVALLGAERLFDAWRRRRDGRSAAPALASLAPLFFSALLVAPLLVFYETFSIASVFSEAFELGPATWASNLRWVAGHLLRHEFLGIAIVSRVAVVWTDRLLTRRGVSEPPGPDRRVAWFFAYVVVGYTLIACGNPLIYERYFIVLSPLVTATFALDAFALVQSAPLLAPPDRSAPARGLAVSLLVALVAATLWLRRDELEGRIAEITVPVQGPLDFVVPYLKQRYPDTTALVIATNYEAHPLMYYLGSHVIVGTSLNNIVADRRLEPDVVFPRRWWKRGMAELIAYLDRGNYQLYRLPTPDLPYNENPALSPSPWIPDVHRFRTAEVERPAQQLEIYERVQSPSRP